jgi:hypothetical protein
MEDMRSYPLNGLEQTCRLERLSNHLFTLLPDHIFKSVPEKRATEKIGKSAIGSPRIGLKKVPLRRWSSVTYPRQQAEPFSSTVLEGKRRGLQ